MLQPQCNHDSKYWIKQTRKRKRVNDDVRSPSVPPKVPPLEDGNNYSQSRETQENKYQKKAGFNLNISAGGGNVGSLKNVNILALAAGLAEHDKSSSFVYTSEAVQESSTPINGSVRITPTAATTIINQNITPAINSQLNLSTSSSTLKSSRYFYMLSVIGAFSEPAAAAVVGTSTLKQSSKHSNLNASALKVADENLVPKNGFLRKTPTAKKYHVNEDDVIFLAERKSKSAKRSFVSATETTPKAKKKPTLTVNNVTKPKDIEWITLDSDTDDEMSNDAIVAKVPAKTADSSATFSNNSAFSNDIETEAAMNITSTTETFTEDTFIQILNAAPSFSTSSVNESTVISPMKVHDQNIASKEKSAEAVPKSDSTLQNNNYGGILVKSQISSKITPTPPRTNERGDLLLSWITNISNFSMESLLDSESDDFSIVEHPPEAATTSPASATIKDQTTDAQLTIGARYSNPKATAKFISQRNSKSSSFSAMIDNQIVPPYVDSQLNLNIPSSSASINNQGARYSNSKTSTKVTSQLSSVDTTINSKNGSSKVKSGLNLASSSTAIATFIEMVSEIVARKLNVTTSSDDTTRSNPNDSSKINRQLNISSTSAAINTRTDDAPPKVTSSACSNDVPTTSDDNERTVINNQTPLSKVTPRLNLAPLSNVAAIDTETVSKNVASQLNPTTSSTDTVRSNSTASPEIASSLFSNSASGTSNVQNNHSINQSTDNDRTVTHYKKSQTDPKETDIHEHKDSLTYFVAQKRQEILRAPEILDNLVGIDALKSFTVLSYNVLSQSKLEKNRKLYPKIKEMPQIFQWNYRWKLLSIELDRFHADICCLQEVEKDMVEKYYHPKMVGIKNYKSFYAWNKKGEISDGCAIYWNSGKFDKIEEHVISLNYGVSSDLNKANVAQILHLKHRITGKEVLVVNTQLISEPKSGIQKLYQLSIIFAHLHNIRTNNNQSIIFCGDFGFVPYSYLYNFVTDGALDFSKQRITSIDGRSRGDQPIESISIPAETKISNNCTFIDKIGEASNNSTIVSQSFKLEAVYGKKAYSEKNILSTFHHNTKQKKEVNSLIDGKPDYIFYSIKEKINVKVRVKIPRHDVVERDLFLHQRLSLPDKEPLEDLVKCTPHRITGSDHLPLFAEFFFT
uniref:Endonuclease/exonuclease/phosphatase domain-containing protein n=1 Tax=Panagrolaimus sp. PS1159 TaxID=55785 RepID=A0AC35FTH5_9BILA